MDCPICKLKGIESSELKEEKKVDKTLQEGITGLDWNRGKFNILICDRCGFYALFLKREGVFVK